MIGKATVRRAKTKSEGMLDYGQEPDEQQQDNGVLDKKVKGKYEKSSTLTTTQPLKVYGSRIGKACS